MTRSGSANRSEVTEGSEATDAVPVWSASHGRVPGGVPTRRVGRRAARYPVEGTRPVGRVGSAGYRWWVGVPTRRVRGAATSAPTQGSRRSEEYLVVARLDGTEDRRRRVMSGVPSRRRSVERTRARFASAGRFRRRPVGSGPRNSRLRRSKETSTLGGWPLSRARPAKATRFAGGVRVQGPNARRAASRKSAAGSYARGNHPRAVAVRVQSVREERARRGLAGLNGAVAVGGNERGSRCRACLVVSTGPYPARVRAVDRAPDMSSSDRDSVRGFRGLGGGERRLS